MPATSTIQAVAAGRKSFAKPTTTLFWMITVPLSPISSSTTPFQASRPASVTTNEGTPIFVMIRPWPIPMASPTRRAMKIAEQQDEHDPHPDDGDRGHLDDEVDEVPRRQELAVLGLEDDRDQDQPDDDRQRAEVARADAGPPAPPV